MAGRFYEEFEVGRVYDHAMRRTITESDNVLYCSLTLNILPAYLDHAAAAQTPWGRPVVHPLLILSNIIGMHVPEMTAGTTHGNLGMTDIEYPLPVFYGDTLHSRTTVVSKRLSKSHPEAGVVIFRHEGLNQRDEVVMRCNRAGLMLRRDRA
ncbi:MAG: MaoC family dehydratase, partial [Alphaproteobacteria bacterium]|nr:MaoC family dehydratase [Alphaproteobacteria bacterium]